LHRDCLRDFVWRGYEPIIAWQQKIQKSFPSASRPREKLAFATPDRFPRVGYSPLSYPITRYRLPAVTKAAALAAKQFEALEKEASRVAAQAESRTSGVRIVSANGRFAAHVQCNRFSAQFAGNDFAIEPHE
jgi:hypothetical protein